MERAAPLALAACAAVLAACGGGGDEDVPEACTQGEDAVLAALRSAPGEVRLDGVALSECLAEDSEGDEVQRVGSGLLESAAALASRARRDPEGRAALELGYLIGAARRGASGTQGIYSELLRRLDQEADTVDTGSVAYRRGERAGREKG
jgi:hypothetical protein